MGRKLKSSFHLTCHQMKKFYVKYNTLRDTHPPSFCLKLISNQVLTPSQGRQLLMNGLDSDKVPSKLNQNPTPINSMMFSEARPSKFTHRCLQIFEDLFHLPEKSTSFQTKHP